MKNAKDYDGKLMESRKGIMYRKKCEINKEIIRDKEYRNRLR